MKTAAIAVVVVLVVLVVLAALAVVFSSSGKEGLSREKETKRKKVTAAVYNGNDNRESLPFSVQIVDAYNGDALCGGVLIRDNVVLTAAHCFIIKEDDDKIDDTNFIDVQENMYVTIGDDNTRVQDEVIRRFIKKVYVHKSYEPDDFEKYDIALLFLDKKVENVKLPKLLDE